MEPEPSNISHSNRIGFLIDIDGVIQLGHYVIPQARSGLSILNNSKLPRCFLTNGGGHPEQDRASMINENFNLGLGAQDIILSHSPLQFVAAQFQNKRVLVIGRNINNMAAAKGYGFKNAVYFSHLSSAFPTIYLDQRQQPWRNMYDPIHSEFSLPTQKSIFDQLRKCLPNYDIPADYQPFEAILVFQTPSHLMEAAQLSYSILCSGGDILYPEYLSYWKNKEDRPEWPFKTDIQKQIPIYITNPDFSFSGKYSLPHITLGWYVNGFFKSWERFRKESQTYLSSYGIETEIPADLKVFHCGKPCLTQYVLAASTLSINPEIRRLCQKLSKTTFIWNVHSSHLDEQATEFRQMTTLLRKEFAAIYCIGDSLKSDITGALNAGPPFIPVLVKTGLYKHGPISISKFPNASKSTLVFENIDSVIKSLLSKHNIAYSIPSLSQSEANDMITFRHASLRVFRSPSDVKPTMTWKTLSFSDFDAKTLYQYLQLRSKVFVVEQKCVFLDMDGEQDFNAQHILGFCHNPSDDMLKGDETAMAPLELHACARWYITNEKVKYQDFFIPVIHLGRIITSVEIRGHRIGQDLVRLCIKEIRNHHSVCDIDITAQSYLESFYMIFGWKITGHQFLLDGIPHTPMKLEIRS